MIFNKRAIKKWMRVKEIILRLKSQMKANHFKLQNGTKVLCFLPEQLRWWKPFMIRNKSYKERIDWLTIRRNFTSSSVKMGLAGQSQTPHSSNTIRLLLMWRQQTLKEVVPQVLPKLIQLLWWSCNLFTSRRRAQPLVPKSQPITTEVLPAVTI